MEESVDPPGCVDYMAIYDVTGFQIAQLCGQMLPDETTTLLPMTSVIIHFHSNGEVEGTGFRIAYEVYYETGRWSHWLAQKKSCCYNS